MKPWMVAVALALPAAGRAAEDMRLPVEMPAAAQAELRAEMLDFQTAVHQIIAALAEGKSADAADTAESMIGLSAMGRHRNAPASSRPGMFMPPEMHGIARGMHASASEFAKTARDGDVTRSLAALQAVTGACVACHRTYRLK